MCLQPIELVCIKFFPVSNGSRRAFAWLVRIRKYDLTLSTILMFVSFNTAKALQTLMAFEINLQIICAYSLAISSSFRGERKKKKKRKIELTCS